jgi:transcriptional regulator with XRE-family HTH domain
MTGNDLRSIRHRLGLSIVRFGRCLGYEGHHGTVNSLVRRYECGRKDIPPTIATLAIMFERFGIPKDILEDAALFADEGEHDAKV